LAVVRGRWRWAAVAALLVMVLFVAVTARLFLFPAQGMPAHVNAIVMLDGSGDTARVTAALRLAKERRAPMLLISRGRFESAHWRCPPPLRYVKVICFNPSPATTQGEAEFVGRFARQHGWTSVTLVTVTPQDTRARLRVSRCFPGAIYVLTAPLPAEQWPYQVAYEWGATLKALFLQRTC
jgi:uncharacterized SAM-binding protein YcdF (DUF218 family)